MSKYEWERGEIKLSVKEYSRVKKAFIEVLKGAQVTAYENALKLYDRILTEAKGRRGIDIHSVYASCEFLRTKNYGVWGDTITETDLDESNIFYQKCLNHEDRTKRPLKPKKKDFVSKIDRKSLGYSACDFDISFSDKSRTIHWNVGENNHARDHAHAHPIAKALFKLLGSVDWTRGTGGVFVGNDEYNQDTDYAGGGGNYITESFGPIGKDARKDYARSCY
jgi:hypothetical protein